MSVPQTFYNPSCSNTDHRTNITNYCASIECLKPLCPECIQEHYQYHLQNKTPAAIQSITNTRLNCEKKIAKAIESLQKEIEQYDIQYIFNPDEILNQEINKMEEAKQQMFEIIELFFQQQENYLQTKVKENTLKVKNIGGIFQRIQEVITQLDILRQSIVQTQDPFQYFNKACRLDVKSLLDRYKSDLKKTISSRELDPINVHIDEHRLFNLKNELSKIIVIISSNNSESIDNSALSHSQGGLQIQYQPNLLAQQQHLEMNNNNNNNNNNNALQYSHNQQPKIKPMDNKTGDHNDDIVFNPDLDTQFVISQPNYFKGNQKFLHFLENGSNILKICQLDLKKWQEIQIDYKAAEYHKSIALPNGEIMISGGLINQQKKEAIIRKYTNQGKIIQIGQLRQSRSSHTMVYCNNSVYFIGGYLEQKQMTKSVEKYNLGTNNVEQCQQCIKEANSPACCSYNDRYIYKFGGNDENGEIVLIIERFDTIHNKWELVDPQINESELGRFQKLYQCASCCQINPNNIIVFGGYDNDDKGSDHTFLLNVDKDQHSIHQVNTKKIPFAEGFWNNQAIIQDHKLYVLQNIEIGEGIVDEQNRAILQFDGHDWSELNTS